MEGCGAAQEPHQQDVWLLRMPCRPRGAETSKALGFTSCGARALLWGGSTPQVCKEEELGWG